MRTSYVFTGLVLVLVGIVVVARTGWLSRRDAGEPMSQYRREVMDAPQTPQLSTAEAAAIAEKYNTTTMRPSGLRFIVRAPGTGDATPRRGQEVTVNYEGWLLRNGAKFDSSYDRHQPFTFQVGMGQVIAGWDAIVLEMKRGEKRTVIIPWWLAYGASGRPPVIPPKASLVFDIEVLDFR